MNLFGLALMSDILDRLPDLLPLVARPTIGCGEPNPSKLSPTIRVQTARTYCH